MTKPRPVLPFGMLVPVKDPDTLEPREVQISVSTADGLRVILRSENGVHNVDASEVAPGLRAALVALDGQQTAEREAWIAYAQALVAVARGARGDIVTTAIRRLEWFGVTAELLDVSSLMHPIHYTVPS
jgi:hypothetical protein